MSQTNPCLAAALIYKDAGLSVIPVSLETKAPVIEWKPYQVNLPDEAEIRRWFGKNMAMGIVTGPVSENLEMIDFDLLAELYPAWREIVSQEAPGLLDRLVIQKSKNDGRHVAYRCPEAKIPGNTKLSQRRVDVTASVMDKLKGLGVDPQDKSSVKNVLPSIEVEITGKKYVPRLVEGKFTVILTLIETRGEGGQFLAHPSPGYELLQGDFLNIPIITQEGRQILINAAKSLNEFVDTAKVEGFGYRLPKETRRPGDDFNERGDITDVLTKHGWEPVRARDVFQHYRRPGKDRGQSASLICAKWFHVFTTNGFPFDSGKTYSPFAVYALLECDGDFIKAANELINLGYGKKNIGQYSTTSEQEDSWEMAARLFPRIPFPWEVLPADVADSLQQLARSCATSSSALPGAAFCLVGSVIGRALVVSPKESWEAPLIFWHQDIRESGEGKTPPARLMARPIDEAQKREEARYREEMEAYNQLSRKERSQEPPPTSPRGYFTSDLTLEGLRDDLVHSPHGGIVVIQDEISAFLTGQNQYKQKGTDREAWLLLFDGHSTRIVRAGKTVYLNGARVSIYGGVQPRVFKTFFAGEDRLYLEDGTLYRFLVTYEPPTYYDLTVESWADQDRDQWEQVLHRAMEWVNEKISACKGRIEKPTRMLFDSEAQGNFLEWRNQLYSYKDRLPAQLRGFLPKAVEYALRITGVIHCIQMFSAGKTPQTILSVEDLDRGIKGVSFYLGQIQGALRLIEEDDYSPPEISERSILLARTLDQLRLHLQDGRLAVGFVHRHYNLLVPQSHRIGKPRGMGAVLRAAKLTMAPGKHDANGHRGVSCLQWDENTETFIEQCLQSLQCQQNQEWPGFDDADIEISMSATSAPSTEPVETAQPLQESKNQAQQAEDCADSGFEHNADIGDEGVESEGIGV